MTTIVTPDIKLDHPEGQEWPILAPDLADTPREDRADRFDPTQGRTIGSSPYDDSTQGRKLAAEPYDDPAQGRKLAPEPYDDPTQGRKLAAEPYDDPTQGRKLGSDPYDDPTRARYGAAIAPKRSIHIQKRTT